MESNVFEIVTSEYSGLAGRCTELELKQARRALALLKNSIGPEKILEILGTHLEDGDAFWHEALKTSNGTLVPATVEFKVNGMSARQFSEWFKGALSVQEKLISANPEHYRIVWNVAPSAAPDGFGTLSVTEALGGVLTKFDIKFGGAELAYLPLDPAFPQHVLGSVMLEDGSEIGRLMHQFRDCDGGMIARLCVLLPEGVSEDVLANHREHLIVEWANWFENAAADLGL